MTVFQHTQFQRSQALFLAVLLTFLLSIVTTAAANQDTAQDTVFLPFKITATNKATQETTGATDKALQKTLARHDLIVLERSRAESLLNYNGNWPPSRKTLEKIAQETAFQNIVVGSITAIGKQLSIDIQVFDAATPEKPQFFFRNINSLSNLQEGIDNIVLDVLAYTQRTYRIASITPKGNVRIDSGAILQKISSTVGGAYNQQTLRKDLKAIYAMGYFNNVEINVTDSPQGKNIVFLVEEKPVIATVTFTGTDELDEKDVKEAANIKAHFTFNPLQVEAAKKAILDLYASKGFYNTKVKTDISYPTDAGAEISFIIEEGHKNYIKKISFEGNSTFTDKELLDEIETNEKTLLSWLNASGLLEMDKVNQDIGRLMSFYQNHGFLEARVAEPKIEQKGKWLYLTFFIEEGPRFKVGTVELSGDLIKDKTDLLQLIHIRDHTYLNRSIVRQDMMALTDYYAEQGYAFTNVRPAMTKSPSGKRLDINYVIEKGELVYINRITIQGNDRTRDNVIRRELRITEGGIFNSKALRESNQALQRLQYFEEVTITPVPTMDPSRMNIVIQVKERGTGTFSIGAGYSSVDNLILMGSISENNFLGRGDKLSLSANVSGSSSRYNLAYTNPRLNDSELSWGIDLFNTEREYDDYTKDSKGGGLRIGAPIWEKWRLYGNYSYTDTDLTDIDANASYIIRNSASIHVTSALKLSLVRDTRNKGFATTEGSRHQLSIKYGGGPLGGDAEFTKYEASTSWYWPLIWKTTFHFKAAAGQVTANKTGKLPVYERFYLGGIRTIRGFDYGDVSPIDAATGDRIGGEKMWYTNFEIIFPLLEDQGIQGLVFFDAGQSFDGDWEFDDHKTAAGVGIRWLSPMGPISIIWGRNLDPLPDEDSSVIDFSIGGTF